MSSDIGTRVSGLAANRSSTGRNRSAIVAASGGGPVRIVRNDRSDQVPVPAGIRA